MENIVLFWLFPRKIDVDDLPISITVLGEIFNDIRVDDDASNLIDEITSFTEHYRFLILVDEQSSIVEKLSALDDRCFVYLNQPCRYKKDFRIRGVFPRPEDLFEQLRKDALMIEQSQNIFKFKYKEDSTGKTLYNEENQFLGSKLVLGVLLEMRRSVDQPYQEIVDQCRRIYQRNPKKLEKIEEFSNFYEPSTAIDWYSENSFIFRLINLALRTNKISLIYKFRSVIQDIQRQLKTFKETQTNSRKELKVYRIQKMSKTDLEQLKKSKNQFVSINTFLWTNKTLKLTEEFSGHDEEFSQLRSVIFEFDLDETAMFAEIPDQIENSRKEKVLICIGTIFRVESISIENEFYHVHLRSEFFDLTPVSQMKLWLSCFNRRNFSPEQIGLLKLSWIFHTLVDLQKAKQYYEILEIEKEPIEVLPLKLFNFVQQQVKNLTEHSDNVEDFQLSDLEYFKLKNISSILKSIQLGNLAEELLEEFEIILSTMRKPAQSRRLSLDAFDEKKIDFAEFLSKASGIKIVFEDSPSIQHAKKKLKSRKLLSDLMDKSEDSMNEQQIIETINELLRNNEDPSIFILCKAKLSKIYSEKGEWSNVIENCEAVFSRDDISKTSPSILNMYSYCAEAYLELGNPEMSLYYFSAAQELQKKHFPRERDLAAQINLNMGSVFMSRHDIDQASFHFQKATECKIPQILASAYRSLGEVALMENDISKARSNFLKATETSQSQTSSVNLSLAISHAYLAVIESEMRDYSQRNYHIERAKYYSKNNQKLQQEINQILRQMRS